MLNSEMIFIAGAGGKLPSHPCFRADGSVSFSVVECVRFTTVGVCSAADQSLVAAAATDGAPLLAASCLTDRRLVRRFRRLAAPISPCRAAMKSARRLSVWWWPAAAADIVTVAR